MAPLPVKKADSKGRVTLGAEYANMQFVISRGEGNVIRIIPAEMVPAREAWLFNNPDAITSVMRGLAQAQAGEAASAPNLQADAEAFEDSEGD